MDGDPMNWPAKTFSGCRKMLSGSADLDDAAVAHQHDAVGKAHRLALVVGDVDGRDAEFPLQMAEFPAHLLAELLVDR